MSKEAMKLALEALEAARGALAYVAVGNAETNPNLARSTCRQGIHAIDKIEPALREALADQPAQQEPVDFASLLREADEIVREKPTWRRCIDGTPLSNDIAVWMTVFAQDVARRTSLAAQQQEPDYKALWQQMCERCDELDAKLAQPQQEPVAWRVKWPAIGGGYKWLMVDRQLMEKEGFVNEALFTSPPAQRKPWVGLTDEDIELLRHDLVIGRNDIKTIEEKLRSKNA